MGCQQSKLTTPIRRERFSGTSVLSAISEDGDESKIDYQRQLEQQMDILPSIYIQNLGNLSVPRTFSKTSPSLGLPKKFAQNGSLVESNLNGLTTEFIGSSFCKNCCACLKQDSALAFKEPENERNINSRQKMLEVNQEISTINLHRQRIQSFVANRPQDEGRDLLSPTTKNLKSLNQLTGKPVRIQKFRFDADILEKPDFSKPISCTDNQEEQSPRIGSIEDVYLPKQYPKIVCLKEQEEENSRRCSNASMDFSSIKKTLPSINMREEKKSCMKIEPEEDSCDLISRRCISPARSHLSTLKEEDGFRKSLSLFARSTHLRKLNQFKDIESITKADEVSPCDSPSAEKGKLAFTLLSPSHPFERSRSISKFSSKHEYNEHVSQIRSRFSITVNPPAKSNFSSLKEVKRYSKFNENNSGSVGTDGKSSYIKLYANNGMPDNTGKDLTHPLESQPQKFPRRNKFQLKPRRASSVRFENQSIKA